MRKFLSTLTTIWVILRASYVAAETKGSVYLYTDINFSGTLFPVDVSQSNKCYSLCEFKDASSVKWLGRFPTTGYTDGKAQIAFYTEKTCIGPHIHFPMEFQNNNATVRDLRQYNINNDISSFMIWERSENIENGAQNQVSMDNMKKQCSHVHFNRTKD